MRNADTVGLSPVSVEEEAKHMFTEAGVRADQVRGWAISPLKAFIFLAKWAVRSLAETKNGAKDVMVLNLDIRKQINYWNICTFSF